MTLGALRALAAVWDQVTWPFPLFAKYCQRPYDHQRDGV